MSLCCLICYATFCVTCSVTSLVTCCGLGLHSFGFDVGNNGFGVHLHFFLALGLATMALSLFFPFPPNSCVFIFFGSPIPL
jgi:hypothetical protein